MGDTAPVLLSTFEYQADGPVSQTFPVAADAAAAGDTYPLVQLRLKSNHGNPNFTCLYRFRVHGSPAAAPATPATDSSN